ALQTDRRLAPFHGQPRLLPGQRPTLDIDHIGEAGRAKRLARQLAPAPRTTDHIQRLILAAGPRPHHRQGIQALERDQPASRAVLQRLPHVDQLDPLPCVNPLTQLTRRDRRYTSLRLSNHVSSLPWLVQGKPRLTSPVSNPGRSAAAMLQYS